MEKLMSEIRAYASAHEIEPSTVVQRAGAGGGGTWKKWETGRSCTMHTAEKLRRYMGENPPQSQSG